MKRKPRIKAEITFLSKDCGGRKSMPDKEYVPHLLVQDPHVSNVIEKDLWKNEDFLVVKMIQFPKDGELNEKYIYELELFNHPQMDYRALQPNVTFAIREGSRTVGFGKVIEYIYK